MPNLDLILVGEAWGAREEQFSHPLVGASGIELTRILGETRIAPFITLQCANCRQDTEFKTGSCAYCSRRIYPNELDLIAHWKKLRENFKIGVTNVFNRRPAANNVELFFDKDGDRTFPPLKPGKYIKPELWPEVKRLWSELESAQPNLIVCMGNSACWALLGQTRISVLRGTVQHANYADKTLKVLPAYHPAAVLRQWSLRPITLADFIKAGRELQFREIRRTPRWIIVDPTLKEISSWINRPASAYAVDIETYRGQISMIGFARSGNDACVIPFHKADRTSYWPTEDEEFEAWKLANRALNKPVPKIFQNGLYDLSYILRMGLKPRMCYEDTMIRHHAMFPELQKSLGFLGSLYANEVAWKTMREGETLKRDE